MGKRHARPGHGPDPGPGTVLLLGLVVGFLADVRQGDVPSVGAAVCKASNGACTGGDLTKTSALGVTHLTTNGENAIPVEPDTGESWAIKAYWNTAGSGVGCLEYTETATVDVDWNGSSWVLSNETVTAHILDSLCDR